MGDDDVMLEGNQDGDMMYIQMEFGLRVRKATEPVAASHSPAGFASHLGLLWSPLGLPAACPADCLKKCRRQAVHYLGLWGETGEIFSLMVSISLFQFRDGFPLIFLLFLYPLVASGCQKAESQDPGVGFTFCLCD